MSRLRHAAALVALVLACTPSDPSKDGSPGRDAGMAPGSPDPDGLFRVPLAFVPNRGQTHPDVRFIARGLGYTFFLSADETVFSIQGTPSTESKAGSRGSENQPSVGIAIDAVVGGVGIARRWIG